MNGQTKILAIGAATQDVFLSGKILTAKRDVRTQEYVEAFPLGTKLELENVHFDTGGGATNAAVTFARQGLESGYVGKIGRDPAGAEVLRVLRREGVTVNHVAVDQKLATGYSVILLAPSGERTVLVYRGASRNLAARDFNLPALSADWFYISSLAGNLDLLSRIIKTAHSRGIAVALNPGSEEIRDKKLVKLLPLVSVLLGNREEFELIFGTKELREILVRAASLCPFAAMTDGPHGSYAVQGKRVYATGVYQKVKIVDRTGVGDAFGSGFVAAIARGESVEYALSLASANATAVVGQLGAKNGILKPGRLKRMKVKSGQL